MAHEKRTISPEEAKRGSCWLRVGRVPGKQEELITETKKSLRATTERHFSTPGEMIQGRETF